MCVKTKLKICSPTPAGVWQNCSVQVDLDRSIFSLKLGHLWKVPQWGPSGNSSLTKRLCFWLTEATSTEKKKKKKLGVLFSIGWKHLDGCQGCGIATVQKLTVRAEQHCVDAYCITCGTTFPQCHSAARTHQVQQRQISQGSFYTQVPLS